MWRFVDEPWQYRVLDRLPPGIEPADLDRALALTPEERIEAVVELMGAAEELQRSLAAEPGAG